VAGDPVVRDLLARCVISERIGAMLMPYLNPTAATANPGPIATLPKLAVAERNRLFADVGAQLAGADATAWTGHALLGPWAFPVVKAPMTSIAGGTTEILKTLVGERVLGLPREPA
jgi:hypothetical protein